MTSLSGLLSVMHDSHSIAVKYLVKTSFRVRLHTMHAYINATDWFWLAPRRVCVARVLRVALHQLKALQRARLLQAELDLHDKILCARTVAVVHVWD